MTDTAYIRKQLGIKKYPVDEELLKQVFQHGTTHANKKYLAGQPVDITSFDTTLCMYDYADIIYCLEKHPNGDNEDCRKCTDPCCSQSGINNVQEGVAYVLYYSAILR